MAAHRYTTSDGKQVPGVTSIIGRFKESGGLMWWANRIAYDPYAEARALLKGVLDEKPNLDAIKALLMRPLEAADHMKSAGRAADAGTIAHAMVEAHLRKESADERLLSFNAPTDVADKASNAFLAFLGWAEQTKLEVIKTEQSLVSEKHRFGGTMDGNILTIGGKLSIADWKSSNALYPDMLLQVGAYGLLWDEAHPENPVSGGYELVRFSKENGDFEHRHFDDLSAEQSAFLLMRQLYDSMKDIGKRIK